MSLSNSYSTVQCTVYTVLYTVNSSLRALRVGHTDFAKLTMWKEIHNSLNFRDTLNQNGEVCPLSGCPVRAARPDVERPTNLLYLFDHKFTHSLITHPLTHTHTHLFFTHTHTQCHTHTHTQWTPKLTQIWSPPMSGPWWRGC